MLRDRADHRLRDDVAAGDIPARECALQEVRIFMRRGLLSAALGAVFAIAITEIAAAQSPTTAAVEAFRGTSSGKRFMKDVFALGETSSTESIIAKIGEVTDENRDAILEAIASAGFIEVQKDNSASSVRTYNEWLARQIYDPPHSSGKLFDLVSKHSSRDNVNATAVIKVETLISDDCPLLFMAFEIHHYRLMYESRYKRNLAGERSPLRQDLCRCRSLPGDHTTCVENAIGSRASAAGPTLENSFAGGIEVMVTNTQEFENLFDYVLRTIPGEGEPVIGSNGGEDGHGNGGPPVGPASQVPEQNTANLNRCERGTKICISPKDHKISAEFKVKCNDMPELTFSTEGEASIKLGPMSVSGAAD